MQDVSARRPLSAAYKTENVCDDEMYVMNVTYLEDTSICVVWVITFACTTLCFNAAFQGSPCVQLLQLVQEIAEMVQYTLLRLLFKGEH